MSLEAGAGGICYVAGGFLAAMFFFLLFSASGSQLVWNQLTRWVPGLRGEWVSGSLAEGLAVA